MLTSNAFCSEAWFKSMFIQLFSYPTHLLTEGGIQYAIYQFMHFLVTTFIHVIIALQRNKFFDKTIGFIISETESVDIDTQNDLDYVRYLSEKLSK